LAVGAQADPNLISSYENRWGLKMIELYGMTEIAGTCNPVDEVRLGSCGLPFPGNEVRVIDDRREDLPPRQVGEILVRGPSLTLGYWQNPEETDKAYREGWMCTGDMGYLDEDGYLYFVSRKKDIIRRSGENISSVEVENVVMSHPKIVEAAAIPVPDPIRDEEVKIYVVLKEGETRETVPPEEIVKWCEERLARFKLPRYIEYRDHLPKTETQKIQKAVLRREKLDLAIDAWDRFSDIGHG
jgi:acyl-coenzyme A synthetase/AMP-(fatty) acid ligase